MTRAVDDHVLLTSAIAPFVRTRSDAGTPVWTLC
jgi:hypothetical protein